jgi:hypothetical protein
MMNVINDLGYRRVVAEISALRWQELSGDDMTSVAWAYYYFSIQFRESLQTARQLFPADANLRHLEREECDTDNLSPWPLVAAPGERMNHDEYMRRTLELAPIDAARSRFFNTIGEAYLAETRATDPAVQASALASYEDGGLEQVFTAMLRFGRWDNELLRSFEHFLSEHIRFDSDPDQGHGALARHMTLDDSVLPLWDAFRRLLIDCVPALVRDSRVSEARVSETHVSAAS